MTKLNFERMNRAELKTYMMTHRDDDEAFRAYIHRLRTDSDVKIISGNCDNEGMKELENLIKQKTQDFENRQPPAA